jgi:quercetin dioxygenase-like cupin family protein
MKICYQPWRWASRLHFQPTHTPQETTAMMRKFSVPFLIVLGMAAVALATPGSGVVSNVILATGTTLDALSEEVFVDGNVDGDDNAQHGNHWQVKLATSGVSNFYVQDATIAPGGYTGWHTHPGVLLVTVAAGSVDWYDANCGLHHYNTGDSFTENNEPHDVVNSGTENARLLGAYITKQGAARRAESDAPACAVALGLP